jgi:putative tricarboxylic transport membrane protein
MLHAVVAALAVVLLASQPVLAQVWKPQKNVELITGASVGGGNDRLARAIQKIWQEKKLVETSSVVVNKPGGGNAVSWVYLNQHPGDGHFLALANPNLITNPLTGKSALLHSDFTPIAMLQNEYVTFVVRTDSPLRTGKDLFAQLRENPGAFSTSIGSALGGANHIALMKVAKAVGSDAKKLKTVVFNAQGEALTALLGGHIDAISGSVSNAVAWLQTGKVRMLGVSAPRRLEGKLADLPTWREQGVDAVVGNWRAVIGPKGLTQPQIAYWEDLFLRLSRTEEWKREAEIYQLENMYMNSRDSAKYFEAQRAELQAMLTELGLAK